MPRRTPQLRLIALPQDTKPPYDLEEEVKRIRDLESFCLFVRELRADYHDALEEWPNDDLEQFLSGLSEASEDLKEFRGGSEAATWRAFARLLLAATVRE
ncbi:MAG: hypothetical protein VYB65_05465 [Myxococcota bacterium]|nr:hypothetical protein [Myxococcota bacterium]